MGELISTHGVNLRPTRILGRVLLGATILCLLLLAAVFLIDFRGLEYALLLAVFPLIFIGPASVVLLRQAARAPESFELHSGGLVHVAAGARRSWTWEEVRGLTVYDNGRGSYIGTNLRCSVRFADGAIVSFNGLTADGRVIVAALREHCAAVADTPARLDRPVRAISVFSLVTLVCGGGVAWSISRSYDVFGDGTDGATSFGYAMGAVVLSVIGFWTLLFLIFELLNVRKRS